MRVREEKKGMREKGIARGLHGSIKYFSHSLSRYENTFDPDSKGLLQNKHYFELAAAH